MRRRLEAAQKEIARAADYEHRVVNDDLDRAYAQLEAIVRSSAPGRPGAQ